MQRPPFASNDGRSHSGKAANWQANRISRSADHLAAFGFSASVQDAQQGKTLKQGHPMYSDTIDFFAETAARKVKAIASNPLGFFIAAMMAGAYVGLGIIAIFSIGQGVDPAIRPLAMGLTFAIALTLVVFAGAELFTGHTMMMTFGVLKGKASMSGLASSWVMTWVGNLAGALVLAALFWLGGGGAILKEGADLAYNTAAAKMHAAPLALVAKGILCNWLVCLALWTSARTSNDAAKLILIFWCLFAFIASGFEHSVANMTLFAVALLGNHPDTVTIGGMFYNLLWVTLGNIIAGVVFVGFGYFAANGRVTPVASVNPMAVPAE
jgi:nitrite transporter